MPISPESATHRARAVEDTLSILLFGNVVQMIGVRARLNIFTGRGKERGYWIMVGRLDEMERGAVWLANRSKHRVLTYRDMDRCLTRMRVTVAWAGPSVWKNHRGKAGYTELVAALKGYDPTTAVIVRHEFIFSDDGVNVNCITETAVHSLTKATEHAVALQHAVYGRSDPAATLHSVVSAERGRNPLAEALVAECGQAWKDCSLPEAALFRALDGHNRVPWTVTVPRCAACDKRAGDRCASCSFTVYCGSECQRTDWPNHKMHCRLLAVLAAVGDVCATRPDRAARAAPP